jgi:cytochrome c peroxidase
MKTRFFFLGFFLCLAVGINGSVFAHGKPAPGLNTVRVPKVTGLVAGSSPIIVNQKFARILGKALFWDTAISSDGTACASCHYHAGADERSKNQLNTGDLDDDRILGLTFQPTKSGSNPSSRINTNYQLRKSDFPMWAFADPGDKNSKLLFSTDDVVGSQGTFMANFVRVNPPAQDDVCNSIPDNVYHDVASGRNTRQTTNRNAPTVINAAFNFRNFWDGRANNIFNGESPWGDRDSGAGVWVTQGHQVKKVRLNLTDSSLASQAVAPPVNSVEMSCAQRHFHDVAAKVLGLPGLSGQDVAVDDSLLSEVRSPSGRGLSITYRDLITKAFAKKYWSSQIPVNVEGKSYTQMEANFPMFFGLAVQMYESILISDKTPFDTPMTPYPDQYVVGGKVPSGLSPAQKRGLIVFLDNHCAICHAGPTFSAAANPSIFRVHNGDGPVLVSRVAYGFTPNPSDIAYALGDVGFANTGVVPESYDPGQNASDPWGNPLSFTAQYLNALKQGQVSLIDPVTVYACDMEYPFIVDWDDNTLRDDPNGFKPGKCRGRRGAARVPTVAGLNQQLELPDQGEAFATLNTFKIPTLRNVELTGPYMHNGSMKSLIEVAQFYNRGGNVNNKDILQQAIFPFGMPDQDVADLVEFLKSLTDERVRWERAPFDHPSLALPDGSSSQASPINAGFAADQFEMVPAVGKDGRSTVLGPLKSFEDSLPE